LTCTNPVRDPGLSVAGRVPITPLHPRDVLAVTGALFAALALFATLAGLLPAEASIREALLSIAFPAVISAMRIVNAAGDWRVLVPGTLLLLALPRARARWWLWLLLIVAGALLPDALKPLVGRTRPDAASFGFPSGHATAAATFFGTVAYLAGSLPSPACQFARLVALVVILLVGTARIVLRAHWPSDVLGGIALGLALVSTAALIDAGQLRPRRPGP
jgi:membrane-associated phospholipid phosphatase